MTVDDRLPAGNVVVERIEGDTVYLSRELRDTTGDWFYWAFLAAHAGDPPRSPSMRGAA